LCARAGEEKKTPLLVVCVASKQKEGEKLTPKEGEKLEAEGEKFRLLFPHTNELL